jgi:hypothetical protein
MWVTAKVLAQEIGCTEETIRTHARTMERQGYPVKAKIGRPAQFNREAFLRYVFPGWKEEGETCSNSAD